MRLRCEEEELGTEGVSRGEGGLLAGRVEHCRLTFLRAS